MPGTIKEKLDYLAGTKTAIKQAIEAKGVTVAPEETFRGYATKIGEIQAGGGSRKPYDMADVVSGYAIEKAIADTGILTVSFHEFGNAPRFKENILRGEYDLKEVHFESIVGDVYLDSACFAECPNLTKVVAQPGTTIYTIGSTAFRGSEKLTEGPLSGSINEISYQAFYECRQLAADSISVGINGIGNEAFYYCRNLNLSSLYIDGVLYARAFLGASCAQSLEITMGGWSGPIEIQQKSLAFLTPDVKVRFKWENQRGGSLNIDGSPFYDSYVPSAVYFEMNFVPTLNTPGQFQNISVHVKSDMLTQFQQDTNWGQCNLVGDIY